MPWHQWVDDQLAAIRAAGQWRHTRSFDALGASVILVRRQASDPPWAAAPCFDVAYQNAAWSVVLRDAHACATTAAATSEGSAP